MRLGRELGASAVFAHLPSRSPAGQELATRVVLEWKRRQGSAVSLDDVFAATRLRVWANEVMLGSFADIWDLLARRPSHVSEAPLSPMLPEFWMEAAPDGVEEMREGSPIDGFRGRVVLTEGAWRTLDAFIYIWEETCSFQATLLAGDTVYNIARAVQIALSFHTRAPAPDQDCVSTEPHLLDIAIDAACTDHYHSDMLIQATATQLLTLPMAAVARLGSVLSCASFVNGAYSALYDTPCSLRVVGSLSRTSSHAMLESVLDLVEQQGSSDRHVLLLCFVAKACQAHASLLLAGHNVF
ncbi:hypothetical protein MCUN1_003001 [Malassezia cuniculi]|uniref:Uncharacterized protein n=1 Tax=Malassezia cuniculi TaxID=948313 RepID=A0AAF0ESV1_9BASI|nr:hypothetical protein MCUN1_003001 [Malassezia cuniculi]